MVGAIQGVVCLNRGLMKSCPTCVLNSGACVSEQAPCHHSHSTAALAVIKCSLHSLGMFGSCVTCRYIISGGEVPVVPPPMADTKIIQQGILQPTLPIGRTTVEMPLQSTILKQGPEDQNKKKSSSCSLPVRKREEMIAR